MELAILRLYYLSCSCIPTPECFTDQAKRDAEIPEHANCGSHVGVWNERRLIRIW